LRVAVGRVPVDLAEVVVVAEMPAGTLAGGSGSGSDWRLSGMGIQAVSDSQKEEEEKRKKDWWAHRTIVGGCCDEARSALIGYVMCGGGRDGRAAVVVFEGARVSGSGARERKNTS